MDVELYGKSVEILQQAVPTLKRVGVLISGRQPSYKLSSQWAYNFEWLPTRSVQRSTLSRPMRTILTMNKHSRAKRTLQEILDGRDQEG